MSLGFIFPNWICDPHLQDLQDMHDSGAWREELKERVREIELHEREICEWCKKKGASK